MRLIDADALKLTLCVECEYYPNICDGKNTDKCDWDCIYHIEHAPTIDAVEVVRCKDCKNLDENDGYFFCNAIGIAFGEKPNWFCADGEVNGNEE